MSSLSEVTLSTVRMANTVRRSTRHAMLHSRREDVHQMIKVIGQQEGIEHVRILNKEGVIVYAGAPLREPLPAQRAAVATPEISQESLDTSNALWYYVICVECIVAAGSTIGPSAGSEAKNPPE